MPKVLILTDEVLLGEGISNLLKKRSNFNVICMIPANTANLSRKLVANKPDIIILDEILLESKPIDLLMGLLEKQPGIRIIVMNLENNMVRVYNRQQLTITQSGDFFAYLDDSLTSTEYGGN